MTAIRIAALCVAAALACSALRVSKPELASTVALAAGLCAAILAFADLEPAVNAIIHLAELSSVSDGHIRLLFRASGVALIAEFAGQLCEDAGEKALAGRVAFGARIALFAMAAPLLTDLMRLLGGAIE